MKKLIFLFTFLMAAAAISSGMIACSNKSGSNNSNPYNNGYNYPAGYNGQQGYPGYPGYPGYGYQQTTMGSCDLRLPGMSCPPGFQCIPMFGPTGYCQRMY
jgi:hypothetical protein